MADEVLSALLKGPGLRVVCAVTTGIAREARRIQRSRPTSASLMAQGLTGAALVSALQLGKSKVRINLQLECDGPLRGLFADCDDAGQMRGFVKNALVDVLSPSPEFRWRPALGNDGFLSVLRDGGDGEYARSSVELVHLDLARDLTRYFQVSDQIETVVHLEVQPSADDPLGTVAGLLIQALPDADAPDHAALKARLERGAFRAALGAGAQSAAALLDHTFPESGFEVTARLPLRYQCSCSRERLLRALIAMGKVELEDMLAKDGGAQATCEFCATRYEVSADEIRKLLAAGTP